MTQPRLDFRYAFFPRHFKPKILTVDQSDIQPVTVSDDLTVTEVRTYSTTAVYSTLIVLLCWGTMAAQLNERTHLLQADESDFSDGSSLNKPTQSIKVYKRRWYILFLFSAQAIVYNMTWNTWGPIQEPCKVVFGWSDRDILLLTSSAAVAFILAAVPSIWLMDAKGINMPNVLMSNDNNGSARVDH